MKFILKDSHIYIVESTGLANNNIEAEVITQHVPNYKNKSFEYKVNGGKYLPVVNNTIKFPKEALKGTVNLSIRATDGNTVDYFISDELPVTFAVIFGKNIEDAYPVAIKNLYERMDRMDRVLTNVINVIEEVNKKGDLL